MCVSVCSRGYQHKIEQCPCQSGCPNGCPCPDYDCPAFSRKAVLVLNTYKSFNTPLIINGAGEDFMVTYGQNTEVYMSCSINWRGEFYVFGGSTLTTQISKLNGCALERIGTLDFQHEFGACANVKEEAIYLCFNNDSADRHKCRVSTSPTGQYREVASSLFEHNQIQIGSSSGNFQTKLLYSRIPL